MLDVENYAKRALFVSDLVINSAGLATWYDNGSIEKKHRQLYATVILPGRLMVVYIYRRNEYQRTIFIMPCKGSFPGKRVFFGACYSEKTGLGKLLGQVS